MSKAEKSALFPHGNTVAELDEIHEMIAGPPVRKLEARVAELSRRVVAQITAARARDERK